MERNVKIAYVLTFLRNSWFWMGIWVFYYLRFTDYAGIGLIETSLIIAMTLSEVPTGVVADLFGKKFTLTIAFILQSIGMGMLAFAHDVSWIVAGVFIAGIGGAFYSGTLDALVYDSLKESGKEHTFDKVIGKLTGISLMGPAIAGVIGGFLYYIQPNIPFILQTVCYVIAIPMTFFLTEPHIEKTGASIKGFVMQTTLGMRELFKNQFLVEQTILLVGTGAIGVICYEMLNDILAVEFGFKPASLAIVWSVLYVICALISQFTDKLRKYISYEKMTIVLGILVGLTLIVSPIGGLIVGGLSIALRAFFQTVYMNASSILVNKQIDSKYRTTTLSSFNLLKNIPYVLTAYFLGGFADKFTAGRLAFLLGIALILFIIPQIFLYNKRKLVM